MIPAATPTVNGYSSRYWPVAPPSITCKREAPRNDGDTGVVYVVGTPKVKSARILICVLSGPGCSGRPGRVDRLGSRWMIPVADRYRNKAGVSCEISGELVRKTHAGTESTTWIQVLGALLRPSICHVPARTGNVSGRGRRIGQQIAPGEAHPCATCRRCHVSLVPRVAPPRARRQSDTSNFEISNFELEWGIGGKSNRRLENRFRVLRPTLVYK
ncbi:hypothetical protein TIFTF001_033779 [Ficus carica]|uniref:Uncharacterized protein n=1 Tax=Ficus carica TaxID=3494 RepID=A0AA88DZC7_FICCA|nr:hypothetical protein TIFTF001_033779 [Ficus carica]